MTCARGASRARRWWRSRPREGEHIGYRRSVGWPAGTRRVLAATMVVALVSLAGGGREGAPAPGSAARAVIPACEGAQSIVFGSYKRSYRALLAAAVPRAAARDLVRR